MLNRTLNILVAACIFACPLVCRDGGQCCGIEHAAQKHACCEGCGANPAHNDRDRGDNREHGSDDCYECICGGAVVEITTLHLYLDVCEWITPSAAVEIPVDISEPQHDFAGTLLLPDDDMNPGRALRCRIMSFLC
jgi:hypothetical protein